MKTVIELRFSVLTLLKLPEMADFLKWVIEGGHLSAGLIQKRRCGGKWGREKLSTLQARPTTFLSSEMDSSSKPIRAVQASPQTERGSDDRKSDSNRRRRSMKYAYSNVPTARHRSRYMESSESLWKTTATNISRHTDGGHSWEKPYNLTLPSRIFPSDYRINWEPSCGLMTKCHFANSSVAPNSFEYHFSLMDSNEWHFPICTRRVVHTGFQMTRAFLTI